MKSAGRIFRLFALGAAVALIGFGTREATRAAPPELVPGSVAVSNGDVNADGTRDLSDAIYILNYLFSGGPAPRPLACEPDAALHNGDVNGSQAIEMSDAVFLLNWLFRGGRTPEVGCPLD
jgi:hypothetical protein